MKLLAASLAGLSSSGQSAFRRAFPVAPVRQNPTHAESVENTPTNEAYRRRRLPLYIREESTREW